jgi:hypothetical protein
VFLVHSTFDFYYKNAAKKIGGNALGLNGKTVFFIVILSTTATKQL